MVEERDRVADGRYELVRRIGRGSSGEVWLANDQRLNREVAIKRAPIPAHLSDAERRRVRKRLEREARAAARLGRPGVVPLFDVHVTDETVDLVMAYIDAPNLQQHVQEHGPLTDEEAARVALVILNVLEDAHGQGVIHRDIKPSNVLVAEDLVRLTDFGIAALTDDTDLTRTGVTLGSPSYMPPEQAEGSEAAPPADFWGLGATLYYAISGEPPFKRDRAIATIHAVVNQPHTPLEGDHALAPLIDRLLQKDPAARPSAEEIREALQEVAGDDPSIAETQVIPTAGETIGTPEDDTRRDADALAAAAPIREEEVDTGRVAAGSQAPDRSGPGATQGAPVTPPVPRDTTGTDEGSSRSRRLPVAAGIAVAVAAVALGLGSLGGGAGEDDPVAMPSQPTDAAPGQSDPKASADAEPTPTDPTREPAAEPSTEPDAPGSTVTPAPQSEENDTPTVEPASATAPDGWEVHEGATWSVATPDGWERREDTGNRIDLVDPSTGAYLRIDWTDDPQPDPEADWERKSDAFAQRYGGYEEIRIDTVDYRDYPAAIWEYAYETEGQRFHAYNLGFVATGHGYALNYQTPAGDWQDMEPLFDGFTSSFEPR